MALFRQTLFMLRQTISHSIPAIPYNNTCRSISRWVAPTLRELQLRKKKAGPQPPQPRSAFLEWNYDAEVYAFSKRLGEEFDESLLKQAFTQRSYVIKQELAGEQSEILSDNSELIKEGTQFITNYIKQKYESRYLPDIVNAIVQYLTSEEILAHVAIYMGVKDLILSSDYPPEKRVLANTFTAIIGALKASSADERTGKFVDDFLICQLYGKELFDIWNLEDPYTYLLQMLEDNSIEARLCNKSAVNTILANYQVGLYNKDKTLIGLGWGESVDTAKECAALDAIQRLQNVTRLY